MSAAMERLAQTLNLLDTARASPDGVSTGAARDAREWLEEAARAVVAEQRKVDAVDQYYKDRNASGLAALAK